jgi:hypothetical protein
MTSLSYTLFSEMQATNISILTQPASNYNESRVKASRKMGDYLDNMIVKVTAANGFPVIQYPVVLVLDRNRSDSNYKDAILDLSDPFWTESIVM